MNDLLKTLNARIRPPRGNVMVYLVVLMLIFGVLSVIMVSLFSTSVTSSATRNDNRRAMYLSEAGLRYGMSELRSREFSQDSVNDLNDVIYRINRHGSFDLNVFAHQFDSPTDQEDKSANDSISLKVTKGEIFPDFLIKLPSSQPYISIVNIDHSPSSNLKDDPNNAGISGHAYTDSKSFDLTLADQLSISNNNRLFLAVKPHEAANLIPTGGAAAFIDLQISARDVFPKRDGSFLINDDEKRTFFYRTAEDKSEFIRLNNITVSDGLLSSVTVAAEDFIVLPRNNYVIASKGKSEEVSFGGDMDHSASVANRKRESLDDNYDIGDKNLTYSSDPILGDFNLLLPAGKQLITLDDTNKTITLGAGQGPSFGAVWFKDTRSVGGQRNFCSTGKCQFERGIRVFFTFSTTGDSGDGFVFALSNGEENTISSVGGDIQQSELLGYAGDSRLVANPSAPPSTDFLDGTGTGLKSPKIGLEFDTRVDYSAAFEKNQKYCASGNLIPDTRNDPLTSDKHAVQFVFWGKDALNPTCRDTPGRATYDDNRHDAVGFGSGTWAKNLFGSTNSAPAIGTDGTIYVGSAATTLYAVNPDGTEKWAFGTPTGNVFSPVIAGGRIYVNASDNQVYALSLSNGTGIWSVPTIGPLTARPAVDDDFVYVSSGNSLVKIDSLNGTTVLGKFISGIIVTSPPVLSQSGNAFYVGFNDGRLHARKTSDLDEVAGWPSSFIGAMVGSPTVDDDNGFIYVSAGNSLFKIDPSAPTAVPAQFTPGSSSPTSTPTLSKDGATVYVGFSNGKLYALNASNLSLKWSYPSSGSIGSLTTPAVDDNENIYVGSDNDYVYALFADGSLKWEFNTGGDVFAKAATGKDGTVYAGSNLSGGQLWAINQFAEPRNYRQNFVNPPKPELAKNLVAYSAGEAVTPYLTKTILNPNKWFKDGPWAVRMEIDRVALPGDSAGYALRTWVQQCADSNCTNVRGTFFEDTRINYDPPAKQANLVQSFELDSTRNLKFNTFLFGFVSAKSSGDDQVITIDNFKLSFIRPGDPVIDVE